MSYCLYSKLQEAIAKYPSRYYRRPPTSLKMKTLSSTLVAISSLASLVQAVPKVTPVLDDRGCAAYPLYGPGTGFVAHFSIEVNQCTDPETSEPCSIEGYGPNFEGRRIDGEEHFTQGYVCLFYTCTSTTYIHSNHLFLTPQFSSLDHHRRDQRPSQDKTTMRHGRGRG